MNKEGTIVVFINSTPGTVVSTQQSIVIINNSSFMAVSSTGVPMTSPSLQETNDEKSWRVSLEINTKNIFGHELPVGIKAEAEYKEKKQTINQN